MLNSRAYLNTSGHLALVVCMAAACLLVVPAPASAELDQDGGGWLVLVKSGDFESVSPKLSRLKYWFDSQVRFLGDSDGYDQSLIRPGLGWGIFDSGSLWVGYNWLHTGTGAAATDEHQVWEQFSWSEPAGVFSRLWRTRLEQRFRTDSGDVGLRLRQLFKTTLPIRKGSPFSIAAYDEVFFHLKSTDWGNAAGLDQNRFFIGVAWKLPGRLGSTLELGYLNQYINKATGPNRLNHLVSLTAFFN